MVCSLLFLNYKPPKMKRYDKYKESGISWIGEIPEHWEVKKMRELIDFFSDKGYPNETLLSVVRERGVIIRNTESKEENHNYIPNDLSRRPDRKSVV